MKKVISETSGAVFSLPWFVARDEGFFAAEGIDMEFVESFSVKVDRHTENHEDVDPILGHTPFEDRQVVTTGLERRVRSVRPTRVNWERR